jgi:hypothetical protein
MLSGPGASIPGYFFEPDLAHAASLKIEKFK